jgi:MinD superfamily P-loop ATPase
VTRRIPVIDNARCTHCGKCARFCQFNALTCLPNVTLVHPELCHSCGGCTIVCPSGAIREERVSVGSIQCGNAEGIVFVSGTFTVGLANSTPVIRAAKDAAKTRGLLDSSRCPAGTSCAMMETVKAAIT